jgi:hypothetical protein
MKSGVQTNHHYQVLQLLMVITTALILDMQAYIQNSSTSSLGLKEGNALTPLLEWSGHHNIAQTPSLTTSARLRDTHHVKGTEIIRT